MHGAERGTDHMRGHGFRIVVVALAGFLTGAALVFGLFGAPVRAAEKGIGSLASVSAYRQFVDDFWPRARRAGISRRTYKRAFRDMRPDVEVLQRLRRQPEFHLTAEEYLRQRLTEKRITTGAAMLRRHRSLLRRLQLRYGVDRHILLAIWGIESNYGTHTGKHEVIRALATLAAFGGRYRRYGRQQLLAALKILQAGDISVAGMRGSWAGAMGQTQFIPTTYLGYAIDADGDGRRDIWNSVADGLGSAANYLKRRGWRRGLPWGWEVTVPPRARRLVGRRHARSVAAWEKLGVRPQHARVFYARRARAWLVRLRGSRRYFLVTRNFRALLAYNNAKTYAVAVGLLADAIARAASRPNRKALVRYKPLPDATASISANERARLEALAAAAAAGLPTPR